MSGAVVWRLSGYRRQAKLATAHQARGLDPLGRISLTHTLHKSFEPFRRIKGFAAFWGIGMEESVKTEGRVGPRFSLEADAGRFVVGVVGGVRRGMDGGEDFLGQIDTYKCVLPTNGSG